MPYQPERITIKDWHPIVSVVARSGDRATGATEALLKRRETIGQLATLFLPQMELP